MKNIGISFLMFILLVGFAIRLDVMRGLDLKMAVYNVTSSFRVMAKGEIIIYIFIIIFLVGNLLVSFFQSKKEKKKHPQKGSSN